MTRKHPRTRRGLCAAIGLGLAGGMRAFVPAATIALRDHRPKSRLLRMSIVTVSAVELAADKLPSTPSRTEPEGLGARAAVSGAVGWSCAGPIGGLLAGATAIGSAFAMHAVRRDAGRQTGLPDPIFGVIEDLVALGIARAATRRPSQRVRPAARPAEPAEAAAPTAEASRSARGRGGRRRRRCCRLCRRSRR